MKAYIWTHTDTKEAYKHTKKKIGEEESPVWIAEKIQSWERGANEKFERRCGGYLFIILLDQQGGD